jgi:formimidoylglutamate deiminase
VGAAVKRLLARHALLPSGWAANVLLEWDDGGTLRAVMPDAAARTGAGGGEGGRAASSTDEASAAGTRANNAAGTMGDRHGAASSVSIPQAAYVLPGMVNLHSHAFQRALAGRAERSTEGEDSFWTWRALMYRLVQHLTPEQVHAIAAHVYGECLRNGYTSVCEFHYLHRSPDGRWYAPREAMARALVDAAKTAGIGMTLLPVMYSHGGFDQRPLAAAQQRFGAGPDDVLALVQALEHARGPMLEVGAAPHSLRAASPGQIRELVRSLPTGRPLHIHVAEQQAEVEQCLQATGQRPLRHLIDQVGLDARWCVVHATHLDEGECKALAASGAVAGLCPTTEANLGDGLFALPPYLAAGGRFGIGSDSQVSLSPVEELRWLEYGQRLLHQRRLVARADGAHDLASSLWLGAAAGGAQASGRPVGALAPGCRADLLVLDDAHPVFASCSPADVLGVLLFCGNDVLFKDVLVGGRWIVRGGRHVAQDALGQGYRAALAALHAG